MDHLFMQTVRGESHQRPPLWIMRQAGRYMEEYRAMRKEHSFLELCTNPELAAEVTMLPIRLLGVDAAIIFSDLLNPVIPMGLDLTYPPGGPQISPAISSLDDVKALKSYRPEEGLSYMGEALQRTREMLPDHIALLGFTGSPFTLACYMVQGQGSRHFEKVKSMLYGQPDILCALMDKVCEAVMDYVRYQAKSGAQCIQIFDTWAGILSAEDYRNLVVPYLKNIFQAIHEAGAKGVFYLNDGAHLLPCIHDIGADVLSVDWRLSLNEVRKVMGPDIILQGNLDPSVLMADKDTVIARTQHLLDSMENDHRYIFNLGHGITPHVPFENAQALVDTVKAYRYPEGGQS